MIQDIFPHSWDIAYHGSKPDADSPILFFYGDSLFVLDSEEDLENDGGRPERKRRIRYPLYREVKELVADVDYLFSLDGAAMFRATLPDDAAKERVMSAVSGGQFKERRFFRAAQPKELAFAGITGLHLNGWYEKNKFCGACGDMLKKDKKERMLCCPECGNLVFPRINPAVIVGVTDNDRLLLTRYSRGSYRNYALVAGFTEIGETFEETVAREVLEETGLKVKNIRYYKSQPWAFADDILVGYFCEADGGTDIVLDREELAEAEWVRREDIDVEFDDTSLTNEMICYFRDGGRHGRSE